MKIEPQYFEARDGVRLAWREMGEGRPLVLLHGLFSNAEVNWIKFGTAARIAAEGYRVVMPDLRVHGSSEAPHEPYHYPPDILVRDLEDLIAHLGISNFDLGGFSLGARTAVRAVLAGLAPRRLVLGGMGIEGLGNWSARSAFFVNAIDRFDEIRRGDPDYLAQQFMKTMKVDRVAARLLLGSVDDTAPAELAGVTMPTLVVCGEDDDDNGNAAALAEALPDARYVAIPGTHMTSVTRPELGEAIAAFLTA